MNTPAAYHPDDLLTVFIEYPYDATRGQRPTDRDLLEARGLPALIASVNEYFPGARVSYRLATDAEIRWNNEAIHCPNGY
jgi:hypothetical protein